MWDVFDKKNKKLVQTKNLKKEKKSHEVCIKQSFKL